MHVLFPCPCVTFDASVGHVPSRPAYYCTLWKRGNQKGGGPENVTKIPDFSSFMELIFCHFLAKFCRAAS